jgi:hypothetical protein
VPPQRTPPFNYLLFNSSCLAGIYYHSTLLMGCDNCRQVNIKSTTEVNIESIFHDRDQQAEMRWPPDGFHLSCRAIFKSAAERPN